MELLSDVASSKPKVKKAKVEKSEDQKQPLQKVTLHKEVLQPLDLRPQHLWISPRDMSMNLSVHDDQPLDLSMKLRRKVTKEENNDGIEIVLYDTPDSPDIECICVEPPMVAKGNVNDDIVMIDLEKDTETPKKTKEMKVVSGDN